MAVNNKNWALTLEMFDSMDERVKPLYLLQVNNGWRFWIVDSSRGRCKYSHKEITVPSWAFNKGKDYFNYYLCHELAHSVAGHGVNHGDKFMKEFMRICPVEYQHYELNYKPVNATRAGISAKLLDI